MGKYIITDAVRLERWLTKQNGNLEWAISIDTPGKIADDAWNTFRGTEYLPRDKRVLLRPVGSKGSAGVHVELKPTPMPQAGMVLSDMSLREFRADLERKETELRQREMALLDRERRSMAEYETVRLKVDERVKSVLEMQSEIEDNIRKREQDGIETLEKMGTALERAAKAEEKQALAASLTYVVERVIAAVQLAKVKSIDDIPAATLQDIQAYLAGRMQEKFYADFPNSSVKVMEAFRMLPKEEKLRFLEAVPEIMAARGEQL